MIGNNGDMITRLGEAFGMSVAELVRSARAITVTVASVDEDNAYVRVYDDDTPLPVPLTGTALGFGMCKITPNVGSLSIITFANGDENAPFFLAHSEIDKISIARGETRIDWKITPPSRDENGDEVSGAETEDELTISVGESSLRVDKEVWEFNGGELNGMVVVGDLTARLNKLQSEIDQIQSAIASHTHGYSWTAAAGTGTTLSTTYSKVTLTQIKDEDYINTKITQ